MSMYLLTNSNLHMIFHKLFLIDIITIEPIDIIVWIFIIGG
jgi:hypothetical protein